MIDGPGGSHHERTVPHPLTSEEREELRSLVQVGKGRFRRLKRAQILSKCSFLSSHAKSPTSVPITSIYTCDDEYITPYETAKIPGATNIEICGGRFVGHFVGHFATMYDREIYLMMRDALVKEIPAP